MFQSSDHLMAYWSTSWETQKLNGSEEVLGHISLLALLRYTRIFSSFGLLWTILGQTSKAYFSNSQCLNSYESWFLKSHSPYTVLYGKKLERKNRPWNLFAWRRNHARTRKIEYKTSMPYLILILLTGSPRMKYRFGEIAQKHQRDFV